MIEKNSPTPESQDPYQLQSELRKLFHTVSPSSGLTLDRESIHQNEYAIAFLLLDAQVTDSLKHFILDTYRVYALHEDGKKQVDLTRLSEDLFFLRSGKGVFSESMHERIAIEKKAFNLKFPDSMPLGWVAGGLDESTGRRAQNETKMLKEKRRWIGEFEDDEMYGLPFVRE